MRYRRVRTPGGTYFFTLNLEDRRSDLLVRHVNKLRAAMRKVQARHPFEIVAIAILPEHLHAILRLPEHDANYPLRWSLIKANFSRGLPQVEWIDPTSETRRERRIWQRRYWEHLIRDETDLQRHVEYIHYNPVKHGWVARCRLAVFELTSIYRTRHAYGGLGVRKRRHTRMWRGLGVPERRLTHMW